MLKKWELGFFGRLCTPRKRKEEVEEFCRCREMTDLASWWWFLITHLKRTHARRYCDLSPLSLIHPHTRFPAEAYLKTTQWHPLLGFVDNDSNHCDFCDFWLLCFLNFRLVPLFSVIFFLQNFRHFTGHIGRISLCSNTKNFSLKMGMLW